MRVQSSLLAPLLSHAKCGQFIVTCVLYFHQTNKSFYSMIWWIEKHRYDTDHNSCVTVFVILSPSFPILLICIFAKYILYMVYQMFIQILIHSPLLLDVYIMTCCEILTNLSFGRDTARSDSSVAWVVWLSSVSWLSSVPWVSSVSMLSSSRDPSTDFFRLCLIFSRTSTEVKTISTLLLGWVIFTRIYHIYFKSHV